MQNGFDGGLGILRSLNIGLDKDNKKLRVTVQELAQKNAMVIALLRAMVMKYGMGGQTVITRDEINRCNDPHIQPAIYIKATEEQIAVSLSSEGPTGAAPKQIITLGNEQ